MNYQNDGNRYRSMENSGDIRNLRMVREYLYLKIREDNDKIFPIYDPLVMSKGHLEGNKFPFR